MNFSNMPTDGEMSMEDILSSIRKYVSEEDEKKNSNSDTDSHAENTIYGNDLDSVIKLQESNIVSPETESNISVKEKEEPVVTYEEKSTLSENVVNSPAPSRKNPFGQLADALNSYSKSKSSSKPQEKSSPTIDELFTSIAEKVIEKWVNENLNNIVEKIVVREIEKMKSED